MKFRLLDARNPVFFTLLSLGLIVLIAAGSQLYTLSQVHTLQTQEQIVDEHATLLNDIETRLLTAESSQRGYIITDNVAYLQPYTQSLPGLRKDLAELPNVSVTAPQHANFLKIQSLSNQKITEMQQVIAAFQSGGVQSADNIIQTNHGKQLMDSIQTVIARAKARQVSALDRQKGRANHDISHTLILTPALLVLTLLMVVATFYMSRRAVEHERSVEKAKSEFIDIAAHQLRTPATSVKQYLGLLLGGYMGKLSAKQREALETANASNDHELNIVEDILRVARADGGDIALHPEPIELSTFITEVTEAYKAIPDSRQQTVKLVLPKKPMRVSADPSYLRLVFENLFDNASKYSADETIITIALKQVGESACISFKDQGVGIAKHDQARLFQKFSRIENSRSTAVGGTGLGLYWVKKIVELHNGTVTAQSNRGAGTTFIISLPQ